MTTDESESVLDTKTRLNKTIDNLITENTRFKKLIECKDKLLVCYRLGKRPSEKLLNDLEKYDNTRTT